VMSDHPVTQQKAPGQTPLEIPGQTPPGRSEAQPLPPGTATPPADTGRAQEVPK
jgi:hypothetical protein